MSEKQISVAPRGDFNERTAASICERIADGESLRAICSDASMPGRSTVHRWLAESEEFQAAMRFARDMQADTLAEKILEIPDTEPDPHKARLKMDALRWYVSKLRPKKYGDRIEHGVEAEGEMEIVVTIGGKDCRITG